VTLAASGGDTCANQMVENKVPLVVGGVNEDSGAIYPILKAAGVPFFGWSDFVAADPIPDGNHWVIGDSQTTFNPSMGSYLNSLGKKSIAIVVLNVPASLLTANALSAVLKADGKNVRQFPVPSDAANMTAIASAVAQMKPDIIQLLVPPPYCGQMLAALPQAGIDTSKVTVAGSNSCISPSQLAIAGQAAAGLAYGAVTEPILTNSPSAALTTFLNAFKKYHPSSQADTNNEVGWAMTMTLRNLLLKIGPAHLTPSVIRTTIRTQGLTPIVLGVPYDCAHPTVPAKSAVCSTGLRIYKLSDNLKYVTAVDGGKVFSPGQ
jgi:hypothetical protein